MRKMIGRLGDRVLRALVPRKKAEARCFGLMERTCGPCYYDPIGDLYWRRCCQRSGQCQEDCWDVFC